MLVNYREITFCFDKKIVHLKHLSLKLIHACIDAEWFFILTRTTTYRCPT